MAWTPDQQKLDQVGFLLSACADPTQHEQHVQALQMLEQGKRDYPDFGCYLLIVFCDMPTASAHLRRLAGIELKNTIKNHHQTISPDVITYVKQGILKVLADPEREIRRTAAIIISTVVTFKELTAWPELVPNLVQMVASLSVPSLLPLADVCAPSAPTPFQHAVGSLRGAWYRWTMLTQTFSTARWEPSDFCARMRRSSFPKHRRCPSAAAPAHRRQGRALRRAFKLQLGSRLRKSDSL